MASQRPVRASFVAMYALAYIGTILRFLAPLVRLSLIPCGCFQPPDSHASRPAKAPVLPTVARPVQ